MALGFNNILRCIAIILLFPLHSEVKLRVKELKEQKAAIERKCEVLWEMEFCLDESEERREWRENLRRTRSQSDMVHTVTKPAPGKASQGQGLAGMK